MINYTWWMFGVCSMNMPYTCNIFHWKILTLVDFFFVSLDFVSIDSCCWLHFFPSVALPIFAAWHMRMAEKIATNALENMEYKTQFIIFDRFFSCMFLKWGRPHFDAHSLQTTTMMAEKKWEQHERARKTNMHTRLKCEYCCRPSNAESILKSNGVDEWMMKFTFSFVCAYSGQRDLCTPKRTQWH